MAPQSSYKPAENSPKKISEKIQNTPWFHHLSAHINKMQRLQVLFNTVNSQDAAEQCQVLAYIDDILYLQVENTSWASRLRYTTRELIKNLKQFPEFKQIKSVQIKIRVPEMQKNRKIHPNPMTQESADSIMLIANQVEDETLKQALMKLAKPP